MQGTVNGKTIEQGPPNLETAKQETAKENTVKQVDLAEEERRREEMEDAVEALLQLSHEAWAEDLKGNALVKDESSC